MTPRDSANTNGLITEGINLAMTSGLIAAQVGAEALAAADVSEARLALYAKRLKRSFVLRDLKTFRNAIGFMHRDRLFTDYPLVAVALSWRASTAPTASRSGGSRDWASMPEGHPPVAARHLRRF